MSNIRRGGRTQSELKFCVCSRIKSFQTTLNMAQEEKVVPSAEEEIRALEQKLEEKKRALAEAGTSPQEEKEIFREVVREHVAESAAEQGAPASAVPLSPLPPTNATQKPADDKATIDAREKKIVALVEYAMTHTIEAAVKMAEAESPYLVDELHDRLADHYYEKLVQLRKLEQL